MLWQVTVVVEVGGGWWCKQLRLPDRWILDKVWASVFQQLYNQAYGLEFGKSFPNYHLLQLSPQHWHKSSPLNQKSMGPKFKNLHVASGGRCSCCMILFVRPSFRSAAKSTALNHGWIWWSIPSVLPAGWMGFLTWKELWTCINTILYMKKNVNKLSSKLKKV